jgi:hypothetical protein
LVLFIDLDGSDLPFASTRSLTSMLGQLRDGLGGRPHAFPSSVALCRRTELLSCQAAADDPPPPETAGPFSAAGKRVPAGNFTPGARITAGHVDAARERLILAMAPDLRAAADQVGQPYLQDVLEPLLAGRLSEDDDAAMVSLLRYGGLVTGGRPVRITNPIYREVITRLLRPAPGEPASAGPPSLVLPDGRLDLPRLMNAYLAFLKDVPALPGGYNGFYFMDLLRRLLGDDGHCDPHPAGSATISVLTHKSHGPDHLKRLAVEYKVWRKGRPDPLPRRPPATRPLPAPAPPGRRHPGHLRRPPRGRPGPRALWHHHGARPLRRGHHRAARLITGGVTEAREQVMMPGHGASHPGGCWR